MNRFLTIRDLHQIMILRLTPCCYTGVNVLVLTGCGCQSPHGKEHRHLWEPHPKPLAFGGAAVETTVSQSQIRLSRPRQTQWGNSRGKRLLISSRLLHVGHLTLQLPPERLTFSLEPCFISGKVTN